MIPDSKTNTLFLADSLPKKHPKFFADFETVLSKCNISFELLPNTKDIWVADYMPIQVSLNKFIQFVYNPDYLQSKRWLKTISDVESICKAINLNRIKSDINLDGGNVTKTTEKVMLCDKIFLENPHYTRRQLTDQLKELFEVDKLYFVPQQPKDFTGHADGLVRFLTDDTVIINDHSKEKKDFQRAFKIALDNAGLDYIEIPYNPYGNKTYRQANGDYINFLQMDNVVIIPTFGIKEDDIAVRQFEELFKGQTIETIDSNEIADNGGILNCITWNIRIKGIYNEK
ncbi:MAG: agmatine deiminase family protein [Cyclobacteriaceae bacterium]|nr:agmatine deiminase family protein [Cyclobacteriaceae bacterium]